MKMPKKLYDVGFIVGILLMTGAMTSIIIKSTKQTTTIKTQKTTIDSLSVQVENYKLLYELGE